MSDDAPEPARVRPRTMDAEAVRDVALTAYWTGDPTDVSVNAICQLAGVSKPSLYRAFGSEDGLAVAALDAYAAQVMSDVFAILHSGKTLTQTLDDLVAFACEHPRMETGCLFFKLRAGKHRLGPRTRARVDKIAAAARAGYARFLQARRAAGDWQGTLSADMGATYLGEQIGLALTQRAAGQDPVRIRETLILALSVFGARAVDESRAPQQ